MFVASLTTYVYDETSWERRYDSFHRRRESAMCCSVISHVICAMEIMSVTPHARRLFQRVAEHKYSAIGKHLTEVLSVTNVLSVSCFKVFKKCHLAFEMPHINRLKQGKKVVFTRSQNDRLQL